MKKEKEIVGVKITRETRERLKMKALKKKVSMMLLLEEFSRV